MIDQGNVCRFADELGNIANAHNTFFILYPLKCHVVLIVDILMHLDE